jgi:hypothetical protein
MSSTISFLYQITFQNGEARDFFLNLDEDTLDLIPVVQESSPPPWVALEFNQCSGCRLDPSETPLCPIASHLSWIVDMFKEHHSYDNVVVAVSDSMRTYLKETSLQDALGSMVGIIMASGGCPSMEALRPMVRFHLPFASVEETEFRMVTMYMLGQYFRFMKGKEPDWSMDGLQNVYDQVRSVNKAFAERIRSVSLNDAGVNAIVMLDSFAEAVPFAIRTKMKDFEKYFASYTE